MKKKKNNKNREEKIAKFFFRFREFFSIEVVYMKSRLRMQSFMIIGQGVPEIRGGDTQTDLGIYYIDDNVFVLEQQNISRAFVVMNVIKTFSFYMLVR